MKGIKNNFLTIGLILVIALAGAGCIYSVATYSGTNTEGLKNAPQIDMQGSNLNDTSVQSVGNNQQTQIEHKDFALENQSMGQSQTQNTHVNQQNTNTQYAPVLIIYALIFLSFFIWAYFARSRITWSALEGKNGQMIIATGLIVALLMRIYLSLVIPGYSGDINLFRSWATAAAKDFFAFYTGSNNCDYPPLYIYVLCIIGKLANIGIVSKYYILLLKLPSILADVVTAQILYQLAKKRFTQQIGILMALFYAFNPATFINSALWGQVDSLFTLLVVLSLYFLSEKKTAVSAVYFALSILMKPQGIIFAPILFYELVREKSFKNFIKSALAGLATVIAIILPFSYQHGFGWIFELYSTTISKYPYASVNADNFFSLIGANMTNYNNTLLLFSYHTWGMIFIVLVSAFSWFLYSKGKSSTYAFSVGLIQIVGVFTFSVGMHERYLFPAMALALFAFVYIKDHRFLFLTGGLSITCFVNTYRVLLSGLQGGMGSATGNNSLVVGLTAIFNVFLFAYLAKISWDNMATRSFYRIE